MLPRQVLRDEEVVSTQFFGSAWAGRLHLHARVSQMTLRAVAPEPIWYGDENFAYWSRIRAMQELRRECRPGALIVIASRFRSGSMWLRVFDLLLAPLYHLIAYRSDLDPSALLAKSGRDLIDMRPVNLLGYSSVLVCRSP